MPATFQFVRAAEAEYFDAIRYYAKASGDADVAVRFVAAIEEAMGTICAAPAMWRIVDLPQVRRYVVPLRDLLSLLWRSRWSKSMPSCTPAVSRVTGGKRVHSKGDYASTGVPTSRKFPNSFNPACWLFSGWNCVATMAPERIALAKFSPYSVVIAMMFSFSGTGKNECTK
ncbi:MAG: type II toxin-antitoxin system RelE/ParE family toxin [Verrucomicrobiaceae bacterium]|nr:MAG: type II toxin-antitoxin system RelE/ParE family toxin [Verrucomicrobiaceae bacterium]